MSDSERTAWTAHGALIIPLEVSFETEHADTAFARERGKEELLEAAPDDTEGSVHLDDLVQDAN